MGLPRDMATKLAAQTLFVSCLTKGALYYSVVLLNRK